MPDLKISELNSYTTPIDVDLMPIVDYTTVVTKHITWANIKAGLKTYFDTLYADVSIFELEFARKVGNNSYMEYTTTGDNITQVNFWTNSGKLTKLFTKDITYSGSNPVTIVIEDETSGDIMTTTIAYSGDTVTSVTKVMS